MASTSNTGKIFEEITSTSNTTRHQRFRGLLKRKPIKIFRDDLFSFFDYLYTIAPSHLLIVNIMKYLHFIQIGILSFFPFSSTLWPDLSLLGKICKVLSVEATIIPARTSISVHLLFEVIIYIFYLIFIIYFFMSFKRFKVYTKIRTISIKLITVIMNAFLPYLISFTSSNLGLDLFLIVTHNKIVIDGNTSNYYYAHTDYNFALVIFNFIIGWIELISMIIFQIIFVTPSLTFRPQVIHILSPHVSFIYFFFIFYYSFITTFGSIYDENSVYIRLPFVLISILPLGYLLFNLHRNYEICVNDELLQILLSLLYMISFNLILSLTFLQLNNPMDEKIIFCALLIFCISHYVIPYILSSNLKKKIQKLDKIEENEGLISKIPQNEFLQLLRTGFDTGHKLCHSWKLFRLAEKNMAKNKTFLIIFAHYAAIYPDESMILSLVCKLIRKVKHNSIEMKYLTFQIYNLLQQRERGLSKTIRKTFNKISAKTEKCRDQLRLVWQSVINGSTSELDYLTSQLKKNEDEITREYSQLCFLYPNNPYIVSSYSAFLADIMCNDRESEEYAQIYLLLRSGSRTRVERSYYFASMMIKTLPDVHHHSLLSTNESANTNAENKPIAINNPLAGNNKEDINEEKTQQRYIEMMIDSIRLPSLRYRPFLFFFVSILFPVLSIPLLTHMMSNLNNNLTCIYTMELFSILRTHLCQLSLTSYYYAMAKNHYVPPLSEISTSKNSKMKTDEEIFLSSVNEIIYSLNFINAYYPKLHKTELFKTPLGYLNSHLINYDLFSTITNKTEIMWSFQHISTFIGIIAVELSNKKSYQMLRFPELRTLVSNSVNILYQSRDVADVFLRSFRSMNDNNYNTFWYCVVGIGGGMLTVSTIMVIVFFISMNKEKRVLYDSFKTLPKSTISSIVSKIDAQSGKNNDQETKIQTLSFQEQNLMRILNLASDRKTHINEELLQIAILLLISIFVVIFMMAFSITTQKRICKQFPQISTTIFDLTRIHSTFFTFLLTEMRIAAMNNDTLKSSFPENVTSLIEKCVEIMAIQSRNFLYIRYGRSSDESEKFSLIGGDLISLLTNSPETTSDVPNSNFEIMSHISLENKMYFIMSLLDQIYNDLLFQLKFEEAGIDIPKDDLIKIDDFRFQLILNYLITEENQTFLYNGLNYIHAKIIELYDDIKNNYLYWPIIISDLIVFFCGVIIVIKFIRITERAQWTMKLLLFCPANIVFQSHTISKLLSNDFNKAEADENEESSQFYEKVVARCPNPIIFMDSDMQINSVNEAFCSILNKDISEVHNKKLSEIISNPNFLNAIENIVNEKDPPFYNGDVEFVVNREMFYFNISLIAINKNGEIQKQTAPLDTISLFTLTMVNITESVELKNAYLEEKESVKKLLSATIPNIFLNQPKQALKEENKADSSQEYSSESVFDPLTSIFDICFEVDNASIVVIDITNFSTLSTQSNLPAVEFVKRINLLYNEFNNVLSNYSEMVKISSLSGTFIAVGGIVNETSPLQVHAKQAIAFAFDIISCFEKFNSQMKNSLDIKIGINTGSNLIAGILNTYQPAFELLGSPISVAMKMAETGFSKQVHITQAVYDLVYSDKYVFKEADDVVHKHLTMKTYLVSLHNQQA